jgi:hypothetical protein
VNESRKKKSVQHRLQHGVLASLTHLLTHKVVLHTSIIACKQALLIVTPATSTAVTSKEPSECEAFLRSPQLYLLC